MKLLLPSCRAARSLLSADLLSASHIGNHMRHISADALGTAGAKAHRQAPQGVRLRLMLQGNDAAEQDDYSCQHLQGSKVG